MRIRNQKDAVLNYINKYGGLTAREASDRLGVDRLAARVSEINDILFDRPEVITAYGWEQFIGWYLKPTYMYVVNRYGRKVRIARYALVMA